jgi:hypothetical protein
MAKSGSGQSSENKAASGGIGGGSGWRLAMAAGIWRE